MMKKFIKAICLGLIIWLVFMGSITVEEIETGKVHKKIICQEQSDQSYSLFLPENYSRDKSWPIVYAFDPGARGKIPVERFKMAANTYGYIVVGSNNARNGPTAIFIEALKAVWLDTHKRFFLDDSRIYCAGFSGGARMAALVQHVIRQPVTGIIACGAGLPKGFKPGYLLPTAYYGIIGLCDMNYREMIQLDIMLEGSDVEHCILIINSPHRWPDPEDLTRSLEWMEISAMQKGLRSLDLGLIKTLFFKHQKYALALEEKGNSFLAVRAYDLVHKLYQDLIDITAVKNKVLSLKKSPFYIKTVKEEKIRFNKEKEFIERFNRILSNLNKQSLNQDRLSQVFKDFQVDFLFKQKRCNKNPFDSCWAERLLEELRHKILTKGQYYYNERDFARSIFFTTLLTRIFKDNSNAYYYLACLYSLTGQKKKALSNLKKAVERGFANLEMITKDSDLNDLREEKAFKKLLRKIKNTN